MEEEPPEKVLKLSSDPAETSQKNVSSSSGEQDALQPWHSEELELPSHIMRSIRMYMIPVNRFTVYCCLQCTEKTQHVDLLRAHIKDFHKRENFVKPLDLTYYLKSKNERMSCFRCVVCNGRFHLLSLLITHVKAHIDTKLLIVPADDSEHEAIEIPQNVAQSIANLVVKSDKPVHCCLQCEEKFTLGAALMKHSFAVHRIEGATKPMDLVSYVIKKTGNNYYRCVVCQEQKFLLQKLLVHAGSHITKKSTNHPQNPAPIQVAVEPQVTTKSTDADNILSIGFVSKLPVNPKPPRLTSTDVPAKKSSVLLSLEDALSTMPPHKSSSKYDVLFNNFNRKSSPSTSTVKDKVKELLETKKNASCNSERTRMVTYDSVPSNSVIIVSESANVSQVSGCSTTATVSSGNSTSTVTSNQNTIKMPQMLQLGNTLPISSTVTSNSVTSTKNIVSKGANGNVQIILANGNVLPKTGVASQKPFSIVIPSSASFPSSAVSKSSIPLSTISNIGVTTSSATANVLKVVPNMIGNASLNTASTLTDQGANNVPVKLTSPVLPDTEDNVIDINPGNIMMSTACGQMVISEDGKLLCSQGAQDIVNNNKTNVLPDAMPLQNLPLQTMPVQTVPKQITSIEALPQQSLPLRTLPLQGVPLQTLPFGAVPLTSLPQQPLAQQSTPANKADNDDNDDSISISSSSSSSSDSESNDDGPILDIYPGTITPAVIKFIKTYNKSTVTSAIHFCLQCTETFPSGSKLKVHLFARHRIEGYTKHMDLMSFVANKNNSHPYQCVICFKKCVNFVALKKHVDRHINKKFKCTECGKAFRNSAVLWRHMRCHEAKADRGPERTKIQCTICLKYYSDVYALKRHAGVVHGCVVEIEGETMKISAGNITP